MILRKGPGWAALSTANRASGDFTGRGASAEKTQPPLVAARPDLIFFILQKAGFVEASRPALHR